MKNADKNGESGDTGQKAPSAESRDLRNRNAADRVLPLYDLSLDMLCVAGTDGYFKDINPAFSRVLGWSREELLSQSYFDFVHPDDIEPTKTALQSLAEGRELADFENRWRHTDGSYRWLQWRAAPGEKVVYAVARDVTERRRVEEDLRQSEEHYRLLVESANDIIYEADTDGRFTFFNPVAVRVTGYSEDEIRGMHFLKLVHPDHREEAESFYAAQLLEHTPSTYYEFPMKARDGRVVWLGQHVQLAATDGGQCVHAVARDITERKQAEEQLAKSEATVRALLESASQAVLAVNPDGIIVFFNPMVEEMFGYRGDELVDMSVDGLLPDQLRKRHVAHRARFFANPNIRPMGRGRELSGRRKDGSEFPVEVGLSHIQGPDGMLAVNFVTDITERKRVREDRRRQARMTTLADGLLQGQEEERRRIAREPHDGASQELAMLSMELGTLVRGAAEEDCAIRDEITRLRERIVTLSDGLRDLSHRLHPAELEELGLASAMRTLGDWVLEHEEIRVDFTVDNEPATIAPSTALVLYRVFQEALRNIVKHSGAKTVMVMLEGVEEGILLSIADHGSGFDATEIGDGAGLGLVSMEERLRLVGGRFTIRSTLGEGTEVEVFAPLSREEP